MINRICISINNKCNLKCKYCHFNEKGKIEEIPMNIFKILDNVMDYATDTFKIGFVGNGEPFLDYNRLKEYFLYIKDNPYIKAYTITNGTITLPTEEILFLEKNNINVGVSLDGPKELHNRNRCNTFDTVMNNIILFKNISGHYPTFNATVGKDTLSQADKVIKFFQQFNTKITFSRMIGNMGITLEEYHSFMALAQKTLNVRIGDCDCTMYGGQCGAGKNNYFFANGNVYYCGNCIDLPPLAKSDISFYELEKNNLNFNRNLCYKESFL